MRKNKKMSGGKKMAMAGMAAIGAGAYYLLGPKSKAHQRKASILMAKVKKEVKRDVKIAKKLKSDMDKAAKKSASKKKRG